MDRLKPKIGFLGPQEYMKEVIEDMKETYDVIELNPKGWDENEIEKTVQEVNEKGLEVVVGFGQEDALHHILINARLGNVTISKAALLHCMNKYLMRTCETSPFWFDHIDPDNETDEDIEAKIKEWPFIIKGVSMSGGKGIFKIDSPEELHQRLKEYRSQSREPKLLVAQETKLQEIIDPKDLPPIIPRFIVEHFIDISKFREFCYDGYVTAAGEIKPYSIAEEVFTDDYEVMGYMIPPIHMDPKDTHNFEAYIENYMERLVSMGYRNQFFDIELWVSSERNNEVYFGEINPRVSHSYCYNHLYSSGCRLLNDNIELLRNGTEPATTPFKKWKAGEVNCYTFLALITTKDTGTVDDILDFEYIEYLEEVEHLIIRKIKKRKDVITEHDVSISGCPLVEMWITGNDAQECINKDIEIREKIYKKKQPKCKYPSFWKKR